MRARCSASVRWGWSPPPATPPRWSRTRRPRSRSTWRTCWPPACGSAVSPRWRFCSGSPVRRAAPTRGPTRCSPRGASRATALALVVVLVLSGSLEHVGAGRQRARPARHARTDVCCWRSWRCSPSMLALAAGNRRLVPALGEEAVRYRPARRCAVSSRFVAAEAGLAALVLGLVAVMSVTPPARHTQPVWPLSFRLSLGALDVTPELQVHRAGRQPGGGPGRGGASGVAGAAPPAAAVPGRRRESSSWPDSASPCRRWSPTPIPRRTGAGRALPRRVDRRGARALRRALRRLPRARAAVATDRRPPTLNPRPPDLRAHHVALHTAGDLFWWIGHGLRQMPAFGDRLSPDERWDLVNYLRALSAADTARLLGPKVGARVALARGARLHVCRRPHAGPLAQGVSRPEDRPARALHAARLRRRGSSELAQRYALLSTLGLEIIAVPSDAEPDALRRLADPRIFYPVVTEGGPRHPRHVSSASPPRPTPSSSSTGRAICARSPPRRARPPATPNLLVADLQTVERREGAAAARRARALMRVWKVVCW